MGEIGLGNRSEGTGLRDVSVRTGLEEPVRKLDIMSGRAGLQEPVCWRNRSGGTGLAETRL